MEEEEGVHGGASFDEAKVFDESPVRKNPLLESGILRNDFGNMFDDDGYYYDDDDDYNYGFHAKSEKKSSVDPRALRLLEFFRHLYYRRQETFKKMVPPGLHDDFEDLFNKIASFLTLAKSRRHKRTMPRSMSTGSCRTRAFGGGGAGSNLKLDRFKVRIVQPDNGTSGGDNDNSDVKSGVKQIGQSAK